MCWRARRTMRAGVCQSCQRNVFGSATARGPSRQSSWNQRTEIGGERDDGEPGPVGVEINEREPVQAGVFQPADVVFDVGVGAHVSVERDRVAGLVGVVAPVAELERREQRGLRARDATVRAARSAGCLRASRDRSTRSVTSHTAAPYRSSPVWVIAGAQRSSSIETREIAV